MKINISDEAVEQAIPYLADKVNKIAEETDKTYRIFGLGDFPWFCKKCEQNFKTKESAERCFGRHRGGE